tara:strand:+ start:52 stop:1296 length:1245 start_codon:yes stop_codon:yes gene_type:complete
MPLRVPTGVNSLVNHTENGFNPLSIFAARVVHPILENLTKPKIFEQYGSWASLGGVFFNSLQQNNSSNDVGSNKFARPLFPNVASVPLKNEIVYIIELPNANIQANTEEVSYYYFQSINLWTSTHHNGIPNPIGNDNIPDSQNKTYSETSTGNVSRISDKGIDIDLGNTFFEKSGSLSIRNLLPYEGDYIYQGRWGNTIRFGSTVTEAPIPNPWSSTGDNGDPIMIFKNGQTTTTDDSWIPQIENINTDLSSIYLTSTQRLPINVSSKSYNSYFSPPVSTNEFDSEQVIINSGRILFNSKNDNILLSSFDTINLNSKNSINIDSPKTVIQSKEIYLGDKYATEPVILGDTFLADFENLLKTVKSMAQSLVQPMAKYPPKSANESLIPKAADVVVQTGRMINSIRKYKSTVSKSK